eukprot:GHVR01112336.1.p1 GENE.GHVR01112336.1~~GHVR01112336.1.p1  ORF type:complete len:170 (-),score=30.52 GHVR01112336.1:51-560(-)
MIDKLVPLGTKEIIMKALNTSDFNRVEIIDETGRAYTNYKVEAVRSSVQDNGKTLKLFIDSEKPFRGKVSDEWIEMSAKQIKPGIGKQMTDHGNGVMAEMYYALMELKYRRAGTFDQKKAPIFPECFFDNNLKIYKAGDTGISAKWRSIFLELIRLRKKEGMKNGSTRH